MRPAAWKGCSSGEKTRWSTRLSPMGNSPSVMTQAPWSEMLETTPRAVGCPGRPISTRTGTRGLTRMDARSNMPTSHGAGAPAGAPPSFRFARRRRWGPPTTSTESSLRPAPRLVKPRPAAYPHGVSETYFQKGFGLKAAVGPVLSASYDSKVVDRLRALDHRARAGDLVHKYAREGFTAVIHGKHHHEETKATASQALTHPRGQYLCVRDREEAAAVCGFIRGEVPAARIAERFAHAASPGFDPERDLARIGL